MIHVCMVMSLLAIGFLLLYKHNKLNACCVLIIYTDSKSDGSSSRTFSSKTSSIQLDDSPRSTPTYGIQ